MGFEHSLEEFGEHVTGFQVFFGYLFGGPDFAGYENGGTLFGVQFELVLNGFARGESVGTVHEGKGCKGVIGGVEFVHGVLEDGTDGEGFLG